MPKDYASYSITISFKGDVDRDTMDALADRVKDLFTYITTNCPRPELADIEGIEVEWGIK